MTASFTKVKPMRKKSHSSLNIARIKGFNKLKRMQITINRGFDTLNLLKNYIPDETGYIQ